MIERETRPPGSHNRGPRARVAGVGHFSDGLRLAVGTLSVIPTPPPVRVVPKVAAVAMMLAPFVGLVLALPLAMFTALAAGRTTSLLVAVLVVGTLAWLTRAMHLDGFADTVDGLGSATPRPQALEIMRKSDVGPMGVAALVLLLLTQVAAVDALIRADGHAWFSVLAWCVVARMPLPLLCAPSIPPARPEGLGALVAATVPTSAGAWVTLAQLATIMLAAELVGVGWLAVLLPTVVAGVVALMFAARTVTRLGGITGDVLGACVEVTGTAFLVAAAVII